MKTIQKLLFMFCIMLVGGSVSLLRSQSNSTAPDPLVTTTDVPRVLSFQGLVHGLEGRPISDGMHALIVTLYSDNAGANSIWSDSYQVSTSDGLFNVMIGGGVKTLPQGPQLNQPLWVGVRVDGGEEMRPLSQLAASPYALSIADKSVTAEKMGTNYVAGISVNGVPVTSKGAIVNLVGGQNTALTFDDKSNSIIVSAATASGIEMGDSSSSNNMDWGKSKGAKPQNPGSAVQEALGGVGTVNYLTMWQTIAATDKIANSSLLDNGTSVILNTVPGGGTAALTFTESTGDMLWGGANDITLTMSPPAAGNAHRILIQGATSVAGSHGGDVVIKGGESGTSMSGTVTIRGGFPVGTGTPGNVDLITTGAGVLDIQTKNVLLGPADFHTYTSIYSNITSVGAGAMPYTPAPADYAIIINGAGNVTLPASIISNIGRIFVIQNQSGGVVTLVPAVGDAILPGAFNTVTNATTVMSDGGGNWFVLTAF